MVADDGRLCLFAQTDVFLRGGIAFPGAPKHSLSGLTNESIPLKLAASSAIVNRCLQGPLNCA